jgi:hypothetical protein
LTGFWRNIDGWRLEAKAEIKKGKAKTPKKPGKTQKGAVLAFAYNNYNLCFGYKRLV